MKKARHSRAFSCQRNLAVFLLVTGQDHGDPEQEKRRENEQRKYETRHSLTLPEQNKINE